MGKISREVSKTMYLYIWKQINSLGIFSEFQWIPFIDPFVISFQIRF